MLYIHKNKKIKIRREHYGKPSYKKTTLDIVLFNKKGFQEHKVNKRRSQQNDF